MAKDLVRSKSFGVGLAMAICSGFCTAFMNFGVALGAPLLRTAAAHGATSQQVVYSVWLPLLCAGAVPNLALLCLSSGPQTYLDQLSQPTFTCICGARTDHGGSLVLQHCVVRYRNSMAWRPGCRCRLAGLHVIDRDHCKHSWHPYRRVEAFRKSARLSAANGNASAGVGGGRILAYSEQFRACAS